MSRCFWPALLLVAGCGSTVDTIGTDVFPSSVDAGSGGSAGMAADSGTSDAAADADAAAEAGFDGSTLSPLTAPASYPSAFRDLLGKTDAEISAKIDGAFQQLFHGDPATESIYFTVGDDQAFVQDVYHGDVRSEGIGLGMLMTVELDHQDEFDRLYRYAASSLEYGSGANRGYFRSSCDADGEPVGCVDPYGHEQIAMALLLAHGRWGDGLSIDYGSEFLRVLDVTRHKQEENGGIVEGVTNLFDEATALVVDEPTETGAGRTRPSGVMPAYYALWAEATGDDFWNQAAASARLHLSAAADADTGLFPIRAQFDGGAVDGSDYFGPESYRSLLNVALDHVWAGDSTWSANESDRLLAFFYAQGIDVYCSAYTLDGATCLSLVRDGALIGMNGVAALSATISQRTEFVDAVWNLELATGATRYYPGLLHLVSLVALGGQLRVY